MEATSGSRIYTEIDPHYQWVQGEESDTLRIHLTGFKKEQLRVQADTSRILRISGERPMYGDRWCRFLKSFQLPKDCNVRMIKAKIDEGILEVVVPKLMAKDHSSQQTNETREGLKKHRQWILNILVATIVVGVGIYAGYKLRSHKRDT